MEIIERYLMPITYTNAPPHTHTSCTHVRRILQMMYLLSNALWKESKFRNKFSGFINSANTSILKKALPKYEEFHEL